jgi:hypothetical protein
VALLVMMVTFSRLYLGVHFLADAVVGLILGVTLLALWINYEDSITGWLGQMDHRMRLALGIIVPLLVLFVTPGDITGYPAEDMTTMTGIWIGLNIGFLYESIYVRFLMVGSLWHKNARPETASARCTFFHVALLCPCAAYPGCCCRRDSVSILIRRLERRRSRITVIRLI